MELKTMRMRLIAGMFLLGAMGAGAAQGQEKPREIYKPTPSFDLSSIDASADPCTDFYKFACGNFAKNHPIPADQPSTDGFYQLFNVNTQQLTGILEKAETPSASRTANEQKIGDYYHACMDQKAIDSKGLEPLAGLLKEIDRMGLPQVAE